MLKETGAPDKNKQIRSELVELHSQLIDTQEDRDQLLRTVDGFDRSSGAWRIKLTTDLKVKLCDACTRFTVLQRDNNDLKASCRFESIITKHQCSCETPPVDASRPQSDPPAPRARWPLCRRTRDAFLVTRGNKRKWPNYYNISPHEDDDHTVRRRPMRVTVRDAWLPNNHCLAAGFCAGAALQRKKYGKLAGRNSSKARATTERPARALEPASRRALNGIAASEGSRRRGTVLIIKSAAPLQTKIWLSEVHHLKMLGSPRQPAGVGPSSRAAGAA
ncbi:hypothetical protein EVAR_30576_1 [Eumeta japonica]|uniref:Uncharacterized protein n=1 Tax=Eumeta variegata TaxID=151549 RepID=A0A4C1VQ92_EUMVA|nr:hypothetical protein EVAR_30576_1 [Eumeta japonica]